MVLFDDTVSIEYRYVNFFISAMKILFLFILFISQIFRKDNALKTISQSKEQVSSCDPYRTWESGVSSDNILAIFDCGDLDMDASELALFKMIMLQENPDTIIVSINASLLYYQQNKEIWVISKEISEMMNKAWLNVSIFYVYIL